VFNKFLAITLRRLGFEEWMVDSERFLYRYMKPLHNGCFVDVGACFGIWTFFVAKRGYIVHAFEPSPKPYSFLVKNALPNIRVHNIALGDKNGEANLMLHEYPTRDSLIIKSRGFTGKTIKVRIKTLDSFNLWNVGLIKVDTEGYEIPVLLGAKKTILKWKPRIIIEVHEPIKEQLSKLIPLIKAFGYNMTIKYKMGKFPVLICEPEYARHP